MGLIYKPGHGNIVRNLTALVIMLLTAYACIWIVRDLVPGLIGPWAYSGAGEDSNVKEKISEMQTLFTYGVIAFGVIVGIGVFRLLNKPRIADFCIATQAEMQKVSWPTRSNVGRMTTIVVTGTIIMAALLLAFDLLFNEFFYNINILPNSMLRGLLK